MSSKLAYRPEDYLANTKENRSLMTLLDPKRFKYVNFNPAYFQESIIDNVFKVIYNICEETASLTFSVTHCC